MFVTSWHAPKGNWLASFSVCQPGDVDGMTTGVGILGLDRRAHWYHDGTMETEEIVSTHVRIPRRLYDLLADLAAKEHRSVNQMMNYLLYRVLINTASAESAGFRDLWGWTPMSEQQTKE